MKLVYEKIRDLESLYVRHLRMLLSAEELIATKTPFLADNTTDAELRKSFQQYALRSREQSTLIRALLERASTDSDPLKCRVVYALFDEAEELVNDALHNEVRNVIVISAAQRIKHYEIAIYGATTEFARVLGRDEDARKLEQIADEERAEDKQLSNIAARINPKAKKAA
jgi:ferritin-like metal-binding protein YciE